MKFDVTLLLFRPDAPYTQILAISRGDDLNDWGLVGGKVEAEECLADALVRETWEESQVRMYVGMLMPVYTGIAKTRLTTTFLASESTLPTELPHTREGKVKWLTPHHLVGLNCTYHEYNRKLFEHLRLSTEFEGNPEP